MINDKNNIKHKKYIIKKQIKFLKNKKKYYHITKTMMIWMKILNVYLTMANV